MPLCDFKKESLLNFLGFSVMSEKNYFSEEKVPSINEGDQIAGV